MLHKDITIAEAHGSGEEMPETVNDPVTGEPAFRVVWKGQGYRGHYETQPLDGCRWTHVEGNWVSNADWDDLPEENQPSAVMARIDKMAEERELLIVVAGSSNVFSIPYDLYELTPA